MSTPAKRSSRPVPGIVAELLARVVGSEEPTIRTSAKSPDIANLIALLRDNKVDRLGQYYGACSPDVNLTRMKNIVEWVRRLNSGEEGKTIPERQLADLIDVCAKVQRSGAPELLRELCDHPQMTVLLEHGVRNAAWLEEMRARCNWHEHERSGLRNALCGSTSSGRRPHVFLLLSRMLDPLPPVEERHVVRVCEEVGARLARSDAIVITGGKAIPLQVSCCESFRQCVGSSIDTRAYTFESELPGHDDNGAEWPRYRLGVVHRFPGRSVQRRSIILMCSDVIIVCAGRYGSAEYIEALNPLMSRPLPFVPIPHGGGYGRVCYDRERTPAALTKMSRERLHLLNAIGKSGASPEEIAVAVVDLVLYEHTRQGG
jgi:predicted Rossmann-fold nucleotide-binding protein